MVLLQFLISSRVFSYSLTKTIHTDLSRFRHNQAYHGIIQAYSSILKILCNPGIFSTVVYPEP